MNFKIQNMTAVSAGNLMAICNIVVADLMVIKGIRIVSGGKEGRFVSMPSRKLTKPNKDGKEYEDVAFPITKEGRAELHALILSHYDKMSPPIEEDIPF